MGLVLDPACGVQAHFARAQESAQVGGQIAGRAIVAGHHQRGPVRVGVEQRGEQEWAQPGGDEGPLGAALGGLAEGADLVVPAGVI